MACQAASDHRPKGWDCKTACPPPTVPCPREAVVIFKPSFDGCSDCCETKHEKKECDFSFLCCGDQIHTRTPDMGRTCTGGQCAERGICGCKSKKGCGCGSGKLHDLSRTPEPRDF